MNTAKKIDFLDYFLILVSILLCSITYFSFFLRVISIKISFYVSFLFFLLIVVFIVILTFKMQIKFSKKRFAFVVILFLISMFLRNWLILKYVFTGTNIDGARHLDFTYKLHESDDFDFEQKYEGYPPGYYLIVSFFWTLTKSENLYFVMGIPALLSSFTVLAIYSITRHIFNENAAVFSGIFAAISRPLIYMLFYSYYTQTVATFYISILLLLFILYIKLKIKILIILISLMLGLTLITYDPIFTLIFIFLVKMN